MSDEEATLDTGKCSLVIPDKLYDQLIEAIGSARIVLIGEASHGTHEFYRERALITKRLLQEKDFTCVGDFPDVFRVNQYVQRLDKHANPGHNALEALADFTRFPVWMWRNHVFCHFIEWLRTHNDIVGKNKTESEKVSIAGLDVYSLHRSADAVIEYLEKVDPKAADSARRQYDCFDKFGDDTMLYAFAARYNLTSTCEAEALKVLKGLKEHTVEYLRKTKDGLQMENDLFACLMNAHVVEGAERYYRVMMDADAASWNVRDEYMVKTLQRLVEWKTQLIARPAKAVVWAHNSHLGDAKYTEMGRRRKEHNIGQLVRDRFGQDNVFNVGFSTYSGKVTCATEWSQKKIEEKPVNPGMDGSYEKFFHDVSQQYEMPSFVTLFKSIKSGKKLPTPAHPFPPLPDSKSFNEISISSFPLERAIGVIYRPETERHSHYFEAFLSEQFDALIHIVLYSSCSATKIYYSCIKSANFVEEATGREG